MGKEKLIQIRMVRENLDNIPEFPLPEPYKVRFYRKGDENTWVRVQSRSETHVPTTLKIFREQFEDNFEELKKRQLFLCDEKGTEIGTATAWFDNNHNGKVYGRIHWVAIVPEMRGKGLSKPLIATLCNIMKDLGHSRVYLTTENVRIPAINLYLKFGFVPEIKTGLDKTTWKEIAKEIPSLKIG